MRNWRLLAIGVVLSGCFPPENPWEPLFILSPELVSRLDQPASTLAAGRWHTCAQTGHEQVSCWGLFLIEYDSFTITPTPEDLAVGDPIVSIGAGEDLTCILTATGTVKCWGLGESGALGVVGVDRSAEPIVVEGVSSVSELAVGRRHACARLDDGTVACWGDNASGQVGLPSTIDDTQDTGPSNVVDLADMADTIGAGDSHACASQGSVVTCWGDNSGGQLGPEAEASTHVTAETELGSPVLGLALGASYSCALLEASVVCWGLGLYEDRELHELDLPGSTPTQIVGGYAHVCALGIDGDAWCWGDDSAGQAGDGGEALGDIRTPVAVATGPLVELTAGYAHTCGLTESGDVLCWGANDVRQAGQTKVD